MIAPMAQTPKVTCPDCGGPRGSRNGHAKLTEEGVAAGEGRLLNGEPSGPLAAEFGVTNGCIWFIAKGINWTHVQPGGAGGMTAPTPAKCVTCDRTARPDGPRCQSCFARLVTGHVTPPPMTLRRWPR
jgi:hypothetical protein